MTPEKYKEWLRVHNEVMIHHVNSLTNGVPFEAFIAVAQRPWGLAHAYLSASQVATRYIEHPA